MKYTLGYISTYIYNLYLPRLSNITSIFLENSVNIHKLAKLINFHRNTDKVTDSLPSQNVLKTLYLKGIIQLLQMNK